MEKRKPIVLTDHDCFISGEKVLTDAHGNNASFRCPNCECGYPVLIVAAPRVRHILRGWYKDKGGVPSKCRECGKTGGEIIGWRNGMKRRKNFLS